MEMAFKPHLHKKIIAPVQPCITSGESLFPDSKF